MQRQDWPRAWLLTDERIGDQLGEALRRAAAAGAGVIVRHHASPTTMRRALAEQVKDLGLILGVSRDVGLSTEVGADLVHNPAVATHLPFSLSVHNRDQAEAARAGSADLVFVSPVYATQSHPGAPALGVDEALKLADAGGSRAIALGGMDVRRGEALMALGFYGWAGIDCWLRT